MTTKVTIEPGICRLTCEVTAELIDEDEDEVRVDVRTQCAAIAKLFADLGTDFSAFEVCMQKPGAGPFYDYIAENQFPVHASCPVLAGIIKAIEVEDNLALPLDASIIFEPTE